MWLHDSEQKLVHKLHTAYVTIVFIGFSRAFRSSPIDCRPDRQTNRQTDKQMT